MTRTVKVGLDVDEKPFVAGVGRAEKAAEGLEGALDDVADSAKDTAASTERAKESTEGLGDSARDAGRGLNSLRDDAAKLDRQIDETARSVRDLAREIAATSDEATRAKLGEKLASERSKLRGHVDLRKLVDFNDDEGKDQGIRYGARFAEGLASGLARAGGPISAALSSVFGSLPPQAQAAIGAGVVGAAVAAAPAIGAVVAGAVVGAAGAGGVVGGIAIAARHPAVQASAKLTGELFASTMERAGVSFVPATLDALGKVRSRIDDIGDDLERAFSASSRFVSPLTDDFLAGAESAVDGFATAVERAGPVVDVLGDIARDAGDLIGDTFEQLSQNAEEGGRALAALWGIFDFGVRGLVDTISGLTIVYGWMEKFGALLAGDSNKLLALAATEEAARQSGGGMSQGLQDLINGLSGTGDKAATAAVEVETLREAMIRLTGDNISAEQANIRLEQAIQRATDAGKANDAGISAHTPKALENRAALVGIAEAANASAEAIYTQTGSQELASAATARGRTKFLEAAAAMGVGKKEAIALADKLFAIPEKRNTDVTVTANVQPAIDAALGVVARINNMHARINVSAEPSGGYGGSAHTGDGYSTGNRWGGIYEHARDGLLRLREAGIYSPMGPARYAFAEPATQGEAFIPKNGNRERSLNILSKAAKWHGAQIMPSAGGQTAASGQTIQYFWQPQQANASMADFESFQRRQDALARVGRPR